MNVTQQTETFNNPETGAETGFARNLAFIIGIDNYQNGISPLKTAVNDAKKLIEVLREKHKYQTWICLDNVATLSNLNKLLEETLPTQVTEHDRLLFYFAGHGVALNGDDGPVGYLIPQDAKLNETKSYLPMAKLHSALSKLPCRHFLGILDCCFAGAFRWSSTRDLITSPEVIYQEHYDRFIRDAAWQIITSSASDQKALDNFNLDTERGQVGNHSPFAAALLEALEGAADTYPPAKNGKQSGDGVITATELYLHLRDRVEIPTEKQRLRQTPGIWCLNKHDKGEYIFLSPSHELNLPPAPPLDESKNPYRGLKSFEEEHSKIFFGRSELVEKLQEFVEINPLTVVLGASGSGKSSLVKAGLIPKLKQETKDTNNKWCILPPIRPGETPFQSLNQALASAGLTTVESHNKQKTLAQSIDIWAKKHPNTKLLIYIDQSEEIITLCQDDNQRQEFFRQILTAINAHRHLLRVVLTLRSDFEPQLQAAGLKYVPTVLQLGNTELKNRWQSRKFQVPMMKREELREAIEKPAQSQVMYFEPHNLVEQLIDEVADMPGALPLLSFALSELFLKYLKRQRDAQFNTGQNIERALTQKDYQELGGVMQSLTQRADEEYQALVQKNPAAEQVIRHVMLRMVAIGGGELARRRVPLSELEYPPEKNSLVKQVIEQFSKARLLVQGQDAEGNSCVEPAHDALVRGWEKLSAWKQKEEANLILQRRLTPVVVDWKNATKPAQHLWNGNPYLDVLNQTLKSNDNWLNQVEADFVKESIVRKQRNHKWRWGIAISVILSLGGLAIIALIGQENARREQRNAQIGQTTASREAAEANFRANEQLNALVDSLKAAKNINRIPSPDNNLRTQVEQTLRNMFYKAQEINRWQAPSGVVHSMSYTSGGQLLIISNDNGTVRLWKDGKILDDLKGQKGLFIGGISVSSDGSKIATVAENGTVRLWDLQGNKLTELKAFQAHQGAIDDIKFSPDGKMIATVGGDKKVVKSWDLQGNNIKAGKFYTETSIIGLGFKPSGELLIATSKENQIKVLDWSGENPQKVAAFPSTDLINQITFSPDGKQALISHGEESENAKLWKFSDSSEPKSLSSIISGKNDSDAGDNIYRISRASSFSSDGKQLAVIGVDGTVNLLNDNNEVQSKFKLPQGRVTSSIFSPNGKQIVTFGDDGNIRLWDLEKQPLSKDKLNQSGIKSISFSPDGKTIAAVDSQRVVRLLNLQGNQINKPFPELPNTTSVSFSPDGKTIAATGDCGMVRLLDLQGKQIREFKAHPSEVNSVSWSQDGQKISTIGDGGDDSVDTPNNNCKVKDGQNTSTIGDGGDDSPDTPNNNSLVKLWDTKGKQLDKRKQYRFGENFQGVGFLQNDKPQLVSLITDGDAGSDFHNIDLSDFSTREPINIIPGRQFGNGFQKVEISRDASLLLTIFENKVRVWNLKGEQLMEFSANNNIKNLSLSYDNSMLAVMTEDGKTELWRLGKFDELLEEGCKRLREYLQNNPDVAEGDRKLCN